jgi:hypothetical protein
MMRWSVAFVDSEVEAIVVQAQNLYLIDGVLQFEGDTIMDDRTVVVALIPMQHILYVWQLPNETPLAAASRGRAAT